MHLYRRSALAAAFGAFLLSVAASTADATTTYAFVDLGPGPNTGPNSGSAVAYAATKSTQGGDFIYGRGSCGKDCSFNIYHAVVWSGPGSSPSDITPPLVNFVEAWVYGGSGTTLAGVGITDQGGYYGLPHALLWHGASYAWKDLNPPGDSVSYAYAATSSGIVGSGTLAAAHALLWPLSNLNASIDLHPSSAYSQSEALGIFGTQQVGDATTNSSTPTAHAILWTGSAASAVDLTPSNVTSALAYAAGNTSQAGCGIVAPATTQHALIWHGSAATMHDINPLGFTDSCARAIHGRLQAGFGHISGVLHALLWSGTARSAVDMQQFAPSNYTQTQAFAFDPQGDIIGAAYDTADAKWHGVMWRPQ